MNSQIEHYVLLNKVWLVLIYDMFLPLNDFVKNIQYLEKIS